MRCTRWKMFDDRDGEGQCACRWLQYRFWYVSLTLTRRASTCVSGDNECMYKGHASVGASFDFSIGVMPTVS